MKRKCLAVGIILLFIGTAIIPLSGQKIERVSMPMSRGNTLYVGGSGPGNYSKIQDAINASSKGDTVFVFGDSSPYNEYVNLIHSIRLLGENPTSTIINSQNNYGVKISADNVTIEGFTISTNNDYYGIYIEANSSIITNNIIKSGGIYVFYTYNNAITHNTVQGNRGIHLLETTKTVIENNSISCQFTGIEILRSSITLIANNRLNNNTQGIVLLESSSANVTHNIIANATNFAIFIQDTRDTNQIIGNMIMSCNMGIFFWLCEYQLIKYNTILHSRLGINLSEANRNLITYNVFRGNTLNAVFHESNKNKWRGNYWDCPRILPYIIKGTTIIYRWSVKWLNFDWHPAQKPYNIPGRR